MLLLGELQDIATRFGPLLTAGAILLSASVALVVARVTIATNRAIARQKATLDLIVLCESGAHFQEVHKQFVRIRDEAPNGISSVMPILEELFRLYREKSGDKLRDRFSYEDIEDFRCIQDYLNYHELVAVGIDNKILDEAFYKQWLRVSVIGAWRDAEELITKWRELSGYPRYFWRLEYYARKWQLPRWKRVLVWLNLIKP